MRWLWFVVVLGCAPEQPEPTVTTTSAGTGGQAGCTSDRGFVRGTAWLPENLPADGARLSFAPAAGGTPIQAQADAEGKYEIELPAGDYQLEANHDTQCSTTDPVAVEVTACGSVERDLLLDLCFG
ncbi:MAG TPA: hypothetical protein VFB62_00025 [Polyangiaceae bacterium]|jgi:hypothetical protein|nr:hypothetical protein [Polyangiaceae bacterium]